MSRQTLVLLPGMDGTGTLFAPLISALGDTVDIVVVRYPLQPALDYAELEQIARRALPEQGSFVVLGESFSGPIAVSLAASRPPGLAGLILCSTFVRRPRPGLRVLSWLPVKLAPAFLHHFFLLGSAKTNELKTAFDAAIDSVSASAMRARVRAVAAVDVRRQMVDVQVPVLYLQASDDRLVPQQAGREIARLAPSVQLLVLSGPHCLLQAAPVEAAAAIRHWLVR